MTGINIGRVQPRHQGAWDSGIADYAPMGFGGTFVCPCGQRLSRGGSGSGPTGRTDSSMSPVGAGV